MNYLKSSAIVLVIAIFCFEAAAQRIVKSSRIFVTVRDNKQKISDLSQTVMGKCTQTLKKQIGERTVELKFQPDFVEEAKHLLTYLEKSFTKTQELLSPLKVENIKFYLLQTDEVPANYKMSEEMTDEKFFPYLFVFKDKKELALNCSANDDLCKEIFQTIPHELSHGTLSGLIDRNARWFDEGLAEYISVEVGNGFYPEVNMPRIESYVPAVSLYRNEIRQNLWSWKEFELKNLKKSGDLDSQNDYFFYGAAHQMIRLIVEKAKEQTTENPLEILFRELENSKRKKQALINSEEIIFLIQQHLKVFPKQLGDINVTEQRKLSERAIEILSQEKPEIPKKFYALYILSGFDGIPLSEKLIAYLLDEVYKGDYNTILPNLAATALARRINQNDFAAATEKYLKTNDKNQSIKGLKRRLQKLSLRPPAE